MSQDKLVKVDLSEAEVPQPCDRHRKQGFQLGCTDCDETDPIPGEIPELKGLYVEIRNPNLLPYGEWKQLFTPTEDEKIGEFKERLARGLITAWNVTDAETGEPLPLPRDDASALDRAFDVVNPVYDAVVRLRRQRAVPKGKPTSS